MNSKDLQIKLFRAIVSREVCVCLLGEIWMCLVNGWRDRHFDLLAVFECVMGIPCPCYKVPNSA